MSKTVLITLPNDTLGGAEQYLKMIALYYLDLGIFVYIIFLKKKKDNGWLEVENRNNASVFYTNSSSEKGGVFKFFKIILSLRKTRFDYVYTSHVHLTGIVGFFIKLKLINKTKFIGRESTSILVRFSGLKLFMFKLQYYFGYSELDLLICQTDFMKKQFVEGMPKLEGQFKIEVIPNPINITKINLNTDVFDLTHYGNYIISGGRLIKEKGFDILIDAFYQVKASYPDITLVILGEGSDREMLSDKIQALDLKDSVFLIGFVQNVYPYFEQAKLCVVSSRIEGFPNVLLQMMSQNHKVVSTKCAGGIDEIEGVFTAETNDVESLKQAMLSAFEQDTSKNRLVFDSFLEGRSIDNFVSKIETFINE